MTFLELLKYFLYTMFWNCCLNIRHPQNPGGREEFKNHDDPRCLLGNRTVQSSLTLDTIKYKTRFFLYLVWVENLVEIARRSRVLWLWNSPTANCSLIVVRFSVLGCQWAKEEDQFFKTVTSTEKSLICSHFQPLQESVDSPSERQPSPVTQTQSQAPLKTAVIQFPLGSATRRRPKWAGWEWWAGDFCRIYTYIQFQGLKLGSPSPRLQLRLKGASVDPVVGSSYQRDAKSSEKPGGPLMEEVKWAFSPAAGGIQLHRPIPQMRDYFRKCPFF